MNIHSHKSKSSNVKQQILELKKEKLIKTLQNCLTKQNSKWATFNPNSQYRSIYTTYTKWQKKLPGTFPLVKSLWQEKDFQKRKREIIKNQLK